MIKQTWLNFETCRSWWSWICIDSPPMNRCAPPHPSPPLIGTFPRFLSTDIKPTQCYSTLGQRYEKHVLKRHLFCVCVCMKMLWCTRDGQGTTFGTGTFLNWAIFQPNKRTQASPSYIMRPFPKPTKSCWLGLLVYTYNPNTWEARGKQTAPNWRSAWSTYMASTSSVNTPLWRLLTWAK